MTLMLKILVLFLAILNSAMAADYTVGAPNGGWDLSTNLAAWASSITFSPGDNLLFQYTPNHDVAEVSRGDFDSCNTNNPLQPPFTGGSTTVALSSAGSRYFICTIGGHCLGGMKVQIDTTAAASAPPPAAPPLPPPTAAPVAPSPPPAGRRPGTSPTPPPRRATASGPTPPPGSSAPSPPPRATASGPTPPPGSSAPSPPPRATASGPTPPPPASGSPSRPPPAPSSATAKFKVMGGLTAACSVFSIIMLSI